MLHRHQLGTRRERLALVAFLLEVVVPGYRAAGWTLRRVLTDDGKEFKGARCSVFGHA